MAQVGDATDKPFGKRRVAVITNLGRLNFPIHQLGLFAPETIAVSEGSLVKFFVCGHWLSPVVIVKLNS